MPTKATPDELVGIRIRAKLQAGRYYDDPDLRDAALAEAAWQTAKQELREVDQSEYIPTPEEIAAACREIRKGWTKQEMRARRLWGTSKPGKSAYRPDPVEALVIKLDSHGFPRPD